MIRVLVVDDHPIVRQGLVSVLGDEEDLEVVGEARSGREAIALTPRHPSDRPARAPAGRPSERFRPGQSASMSARAAAHRRT